MAGKKNCMWNTVAGPFSLGMCYFTIPKSGSPLAFSYLFFFLTELAKARACDMVLKIFFPL